MIMTHSSFQIEMDEIILEIEKRSQNTFIEKYVKLPAISMDRLQLLNLSLYHASVPKQLRKLYCITAGLVQLGLDIHETISNHKEVSEHGIRNRQLSILAGDYYSSQYYALLSKTNLLDAIEDLAIAIRDINISKMKLYTSNEFASIEYFTELFKTKDAKLYTQFIKYMKDDNLQDIWQLIIENLSLLFTLADELYTTDLNRNQFSYYLVNYYSSAEEKRELFVNGANTSDSMNKLKSLYLKYDIKGKLEKLISNTHHVVEKQISKIEDRFITGELSYIISQFRHSYHLFKAVEKI